MARRKKGTGFGQARQHERVGLVFTQLGGLLVEKIAALINKLIYHSSCQLAYCGGDTTHNMISNGSVVLLRESKGIAFLFYFQTILLAALDDVKELVVFAERLDNSKDGKLYI